MTVKGTNNNPSITPSQLPETPRNRAREATPSVDNSQRPTLSLYGRKGEGMTITTKIGGKEVTERIAEKDLPRLVNMSKQPLSSKEQYAKKKTRYQEESPILKAAAQKPAAAKQKDLFSSRITDAMVLMGKDAFAVKDGKIKLPEGYRVYDYDSAKGMWDYVDSPEIDIDSVLARVGRKKEDFGVVEMRKQGNNSKVYQLILSNNKEKVAFTFDLEKQQWGGGFVTNNI